MPIQTVDTDRLYRKIARQLSELISSGEFVPGQRLPAERELAHQLGVSRPSVREALIALEIEGKVEVRVGAGVFVVAPRPTSVPPAQEEGEGPFELLGARRVVEGETAAWAAREATADEIAAIRASVEGLAALPPGDPRSDGVDRDFHMAIARATHNDAMVWVVQMLWDQGRGAVWRQMEKHFQTPALRNATLRDHRAIFKAIEAHAPGKARAGMHRHLLRVAHEFEKGIEHRQRRDKKPGGARRALP